MSGGPSVVRILLPSGLKVEPHAPSIVNNFCSVSRDQSSTLFLNVIESIFSSGLNSEVPASTSKVCSNSHVFADQI